MDTERIKIALAGIGIVPISEFESQRRLEKLILEKRLKIPDGNVSKLSRKLGISYGEYHELFFSKDYVYESQLPNIALVCGQIDEALEENQGSGHAINLIECGCNVGIYFRTLCMIYQDSNVNFHGYDKNKTLACYARKRLNDVGLGGKATIMPHPLEHIKAPKIFKDTEFDLVLCDGSINFNNTSSLRSVTSMVAHGGRFIYIGGGAHPDDIEKIFCELGLERVKLTYTPYDMGGAHVIETRAVFKKP